jgi:hypothetical protein
MMARVMLAAARADWRENDLADVKQAEFHCRCSFQSGMTSQTAGSGPIAVHSMPMARRRFQFERKHPLRYR